jgi:hypothetical protein
MLKGLAAGDVVTVTRIDRLARSTFDLFAIVKQIADADARFRSLAEPWAYVGRVGWPGGCAQGRGKAMAEDVRLAIPDTASAHLRSIS